MEDALSCLAQKARFNPCKILRMPFLTLEAFVSCRPPAVQNARRHNRERTAAYPVLGESSGAERSNVEPRSACILNWHITTAAISSRTNRAWTCACAQNNFVSTIGRGQITPSIAQIPKLQRCPRNLQYGFRFSTQWSQTSSETEHIPIPERPRLVPKRSQAPTRDFPSARFQLQTKEPFASLRVGSFRFDIGENPPTPV